MAKKGRHFINRNDPKTLTFNLVAASHDDPRFDAPIENGFEDLDASELHHTVGTLGRNRGPASTLQRYIPQNAARKGIVANRVPDSLLEVLEPANFGIHKNLPNSHIQSLCKDIYGVEVIPEELKKKIGTIESTDRDQQHTTIDDNTLEKSDCYFPLDGYNYEKHLREIGSHFIPAVPTLEQQIIDDNRKVTPEEKEALIALECAEEYEELDDDFFHEAGGEDFLDESSIITRTKQLDLLWGGYVPQGLPQRRGTLERQELEDLLRHSRDEDKGSDNDTGEIKLEELLEEEYKESDIGELAEDDQEILGMTDKTIADYGDILDQFMQNKKKEFLSSISGQGKSDIALSNNNNDNNNDPIIGLEPLSSEETQRFLAYATKYLSNEETEEFELIDKPENKEDRWDCETILTTRSNLFHHPGKIYRPSGSAMSACDSVKITGTSIDAILRAKTINSVLKTAAHGTSSTIIPLSQIKENEETSLDEDTDASEEVVEIPTVITKRPKNETSEERRARKKDAKEARRMIRAAKKENQQIQKDAAKKVTTLIKSKNAYDVPDGVRKFRV